VKGNLVPRKKKPHPATPPRGLWARIRWEWMEFWHVTAAANYRRNPHC
jgi:hypothetical protein